ncbi:Gti1/Pac2 family-domain-containing protein [Ephemerocybe angulata]|uniref:Gti1/Pac2 family-domain-containing protein n=1 Tax=Ephemerocybe angulata TaxID=980116 RepID=A0A8H6MFD3_9AGAR|nr:Gti1/Pac2 family-domain-containing protein [Tulosesus angulatus]
MCVRTTSDAKKIFEAVYRQLLPIIPRRLDADEKRRIQSGQVFVWEERSSQSARSVSTGIERWTDSISWGQSRVKDEFLFYDEKERQDVPMNILGSNPSAAVFRAFPGSISRNLVKQTYSVFVRFPNGVRKWHITAYTTASTVHRLYTVDNHPDYPFLATIAYPSDRYTSARGGARSSPRFSDSSSGPSPIPPPVSYLSRDSEELVSNPPALLSLAPLEYLKRSPPRTRHPLDEEAIMSFPIYDYLTCY